MFKYIKNYIKMVKKNDPSMKRGIEIILYPSFWVLLFHKLSHFLYKHKWYFTARLISSIARFLTSIEIHPGAVIGKNLFIDHGCGVVIGESAVIGDNVVMYHGVTLGATGKEIGKRHPTIGSNVIIGAGAIILGSFLVGDDSIIGAGAIVLKKVDSGETVVGIYK